MEGAVEGAATAMDEHGLPAATHRAIDQADRLAHALRGRRDGQSDRPSPLARKLHEATGRATDKVHQAQEFVDETVQDVKTKAHAVAETTRRAAAAPGEVTRDLSRAFSAWATGMVAGAGWMLAGAAVGTVGLVLVTMAAVAWLTPALGAAGALLLVAGLYAVVTLLCFAAAKGIRAASQVQARRHVEEARQDLRYVAEPVRTAFAPKTTGWNRP